PSDLTPHSLHDALPIFYCGEAHPKPTRAVDPQSIQVNTPQQTRARQLNEASRMIVEVPRATGIDIYLFAGPSMLEAVQRYNLFRSEEHTSELQSQSKLV